ncbi:MAG: efflux RND transporter periplasmic adaptor subunit [bacterium]
MPTSLKIIIPILLLVALALFLAQKSGIFRPKSTIDTKSAGVTVNVNVTTVGLNDLEERIDVTGSLTPTSEVTVGNKLAGRVSEIRVKEGDSVHKGQIVAVIENSDKKNDVAAAKARVDQARQQALAMEKTIAASITMAEKQLAVVESGARTQQKLMAEEQVKSAQAAQTNAANNLDRLNRLFTAGAISASQRDIAQSQLDQANAQLASAKQNLSLVDEGPRQEDIDSARAAVASAKANKSQIDVAWSNVSVAETSLATTQQILDDTIIKSPVDGVVAQQLAEVGQSLGASMAIVKLTTNNSLYFEANISELEAARVASGQLVNINVDALQGDRSNPYSTASSNVILGTVERVVPVVDAKTRNFMVRITVPKSDKVYPGMFARGSIQLARHTGVLTAPKDALVERDNKHLVFVNVDGKAKLATVSIGAVSSTQVEITSGLKSGDQLITSGQQSLQDGDLIKVIEKK